MNLIKDEVTRKFSKCAEGYHQNAILQKEISSRLLGRLDYCKLMPERILDLGCGTGFLTQELSVRYPDASIYGLDLSLDMLQALPGESSATKICGDATCLPLVSNSFDLIIANLVLHWVDDFQAMLLECQRILDNDGLLLFSTLSNNSLSELKDSWKSIDNYSHIHEYFDFMDLGDHLLKTGWKDPVLDQENLIMQYDSFTKLIRDFKINGITNSSTNKFNGLYTARKLSQVEKAYLKYRNSDNKLPVSYEIIYGHGLKKALVRL